jgi:hypothetical protein
MKEDQRSRRGESYTRNQSDIGRVGGVLRTKNRRSRSLSWQRAPHERRSKEAVGGNPTRGTKMNSKQGGLVECSARKKIKRSQAHERRSKKPSGRNRTPGTKVKSGGLMVCSARKTKEVVGLVACSTQKMGEEGGGGHTPEIK